MKYLYSILLLSATFSTQAQTFKIDTLLLNGDTSRFINMVFLGDGYTSVEQATFLNRANTLLNYFKSTAPYSNYKNYFNAFAIEVISEQSGVKHPRTASDCNTANPLVPISNPKNYFGSTFDGYGVHRLVVIDSLAKVDSVLAHHLPGYDLGIILANSPYYGGSGGSANFGGIGGNFITVTAEASSSEFVMHESGHSFAGLMDEYWAGAQYAYERANMTQEKNAALIRWKNWLNAGTGIGIYKFSQDTTWVKPANNACKMEVLGKPYCSVCSEAIIERVHALTNPILAYSPDTSVHGFDSLTIFRLDSFIKPIPNTLHRTWTFNGNPVAADVDSFLVERDSLPNGTDTIVATVTDTTSLVRTDLHATSHIFTVEWIMHHYIDGMNIQSSMNEIKCTVFPNPATDEVSIEINLQKTVSLQMDLADMQGRILRRIVDEETVTGACLKKISLGDLPPGTYQLLFNAGGSRFSKILIKD